MEVAYSTKASEDIAYWKELNDSKIQKKITDLIKNIVATPFTGIGKPEPLKNDFSGFWSRRINLKHRLIYKIEDDTVYIYSMRGHYE
jgi:toxin YoeB